jgi:hypothetical protein
MHLVDDQFEFEDMNLLISAYNLYETETKNKCGWQALGKHAQTFVQQENIMQEAQRKMTV